MKIQTKIIAVLFLFMALACSKDDNTPEVVVPVKSEAKAITSFAFNATDNGALEENVTTTVIEASKTVSSSVPNGTDITSLTPTIQISAKASINPSGAQDFSSPVTYTVTAEDGSKTTYLVTLVVLDAENSAPLDFELIAVTNNAIAVDVLPTFSWNASTDPDGDMVTYDLYIDTGATADLLYAENLTDTTFEVTERLALLEDYVWRVVAKDLEGASVSSVTRSFGTRAIRFNDTAVTENAEFPKRAGHSTVEFDGKLWVIGGQTLNREVLNDVWFSEDGTTWTEATSAAEFSERQDHTSVVFDNKIWVIGGINFNDRKNDVWFSSDGVNWEEANNDAPFEPRNNFTSVVFDNKIWVLSGESQRGDVWFSADGISWSKGGAFSRRKSHSSVVFDNKMWVIGGISSSLIPDNVVMSSVDGFVWEMVTSSTPFTERYNHTTVVFDNKIWIIGGRNDNQILDDVWFSSDGLNWEEATSDATMGTRSNHTSAVFENKVWIIAGLNFNGRQNDVWTFD